MGIGVQDEGIADSLASKWISPSLDLGKITRGSVDGDVGVLGEKLTFSHYLPQTLTNAVSAATFISPVHSHENGGE